VHTAAVLMNCHFHIVFWIRIDKTTLNHSNQRTSAASTTQGSVPEEVAICVVVANTEHVEV
jgi:hypothetical protein